MILSNKKRAGIVLATLVTTIGFVGLAFASGLTDKIFVQNEESQTSEVIVSESEVNPEAQDAEVEEVTQEVDQEPETKVDSTQSVKSASVEKVKDTPKVAAPTPTTPAIEEIKDGFDYDEEMKKYDEEWQRQQDEYKRVKAEEDRKQVEELAEQQKQQAAVDAAKREQCLALKDLDLEQIVRDYNNAVEEENRRHTLEVGQTETDFANRGLRGGFVQSAIDALNEKHETNLSGIKYYYGSKVAEVDGRSC